MKTNIGLWSYLAQVFLEWEISQTKAAHFMFNNFFFQNRAVRDSVEK